MIAFERPQHTHAMRLPAPGPILKLSRESDIRRSAGLPPKQPPSVPPCNFAAASPDFPRRAARLQSSGFAYGHNRRTLPNRKSPYLSRAFSC
jgi:hypothetical protein